MRFLGLFVILILSLNGQSPVKDKRTNSKTQDIQVTPNRHNEKEIWVFAEGLFSRTWYKDALAEYTAFLVNFPESSLIQNVRWRIYECHERLSNDTEILAALNDYIINEKDLTQKERARMNKARLLFEQNDFEGALEIYESIDRKVDEGKLWESANYESARIYLQQSKHGEAFLRFRQLASLKYTGSSQTRAYAIFAYASLLEERGKNQDALKQYMRLTLKKGTDDSIVETAWFNQGSIYFQLDQKVKARASFGYIIQNFPDGRFKEKSINQAARCELSLGKPLEALQVLALNTESSGLIKVENQYLIAFANQQLKEYEKAISYYEKCINSKEESYKEDSWFNKINCLSKLGKSEEALKNARIMIKLYPNTEFMADICYVAAIEAENVKDFSTSEAFFRKSLKSFNGSWVYLDSAYFALARVLNTQKKYADEAIIWKELSLRVDSEYRRVAFVRCGEAWLKASKPDKALNILKEYLQVFADGEESFLVKNRIVEIFLLEQRYDDAVKFLEQMLAVKLNDSERIILQSVLGRVFYYQGRFQEAVETLEVCLKSEKLDDKMKSDCLVFIGFSKISMDLEKEGVEHLAEVFKDRSDFKSLLSSGEEILVASLLEKYKYSVVAGKIYGRLSLSKDKKLKMAGLLGQARMSITGGNYKQGIPPLKKTLELCGEQDTQERQKALSLLGEIYLQEKKIDQAYQTFSFALKAKTLDEGSICRALYGMARILLERKEIDEARRYANQVFILYKDPVYAPRAMFLSIKASLLTEKKAEAIQTAKELKQKFPLYFAKIAVQDYLKAHGITTD